MRPASVTRRAPSGTPAGALLVVTAIVSTALIAAVSFPSTLLAQQSSSAHTARAQRIRANASTSTNASTNALPRDARDQARDENGARARDVARAAQDRWVDSVLATLSLHDKVAQLVWPWMLGDYVAADDPAYLRSLSLVRDQHVGGIIMSVGSPTEIAEKINALQRAAPVPLLVSADLETGAAFRARGGYFLPNAIDLGGSTQFPYQMGVGATRDTTLAYAMGRVTALEGRAMGIEMAFAPVLDVNNNPRNPVIGPRSFGEDPREVAALGSAFIRGVQQHGEFAVAKHFPGHGDTEQNSHLELARVMAPRAQLDTLELAPFRAGIASGVQGIMTFHGYIPALDTAQIAATLNPHIMTDLLRTQLGFKGLVVTDALDMGGVLGNLGMEEATMRAFEAGADVLLMPSDPVRAIDAVANGVRSGRFTQARLDQSVRRILALKYEAGLARDRFVNLDSMRAVVSDSANLAVAQLVAERAITLAKDSLNAVPLTLPKSAHVVSITIAPPTDLGAGRTFDAELRAAYPNLVSVTLAPQTVYDRTVGAAGNSKYVAAPRPAFAPGAVENALRAADGADAVIVSYYLSGSSSTATLASPVGYQELIAGAEQRTPRFVLASFGTPYVLTDANAPAYLVAWGPWAPQQRAAARALLGLAPITGAMPVSVPPLLPRWANVQRPASSTAAAAVTTH
jgi:beta-N-acetylhexosaminidase